MVRVYYNRSSTQANEDHWREAHEIGGGTGKVPKEVKPNLSLKIKKKKKK